MTRVWGIASLSLVLACGSDRHADSGAQSGHMPALSPLPTETPTQTAVTNPAAPGPADVGTAAPSATQPAVSTPVTTGGSDEVRPPAVPTGSASAAGGTPGTSGDGGAPSVPGPTVALGGTAGNTATAGRAGSDSDGGTSGVAGTGGADGAEDSDSTGWFGPPSCDGFVLCESFEGEDGGQLPAGWQLVGYGERTVGVSDAQAARGEQSLRVEVLSQAAVVAMIEIQTPEVLKQSHWGRHFVRFDSLPAEFIHYDLFAGVGPWMNYQNEVRWAVTGTGVGNEPGNQAFIYNVQPTGDGAPAEFGTEGDRSAHPILGEWMCFEWFFDASAQEARFFYMGEEVEYLHIDEERAEIPPFDVLRVGFQKFQQANSIVVHVDEVAFDVARIGCDG